jgi:hypothetical protein
VVTVDVDAVVLDVERVDVGESSVVVDTLTASNRPRSLPSPRTSVPDIAAAVTAPVPRVVKAAAAIAIAVRRFIVVLQCGCHRIHAAAARKVWPFSRSLG